MLYDKRWDKPEVKADPFSLESLIAWLETMPADGEYPATCAGRCMLAQWLLSIDPKMEQGRGNSYTYIVLGRSRDLGGFSDIVFGEQREYTFGAALKRARAALCS